MIGSVLFKLAMSLAPGTTAERMCLWASVGGSACFFALSLGLPLRGVQVALLGYEVCVGVYLNAMGMMRSKYIPQEVSVLVGVERVDGVLLLLALASAALFWVCSRQTRQKRYFASVRSVPG